MRARLGIGLVLVLTASVMGPQPGLGPERAAAGAGQAVTETRSGTCTEAGVTWQVDYDYQESPVFGPLVTVTGLRRIEGGADDNAADEIWDLRWGLEPHEWPPPTDDAPPGWSEPHHVERGPLSVVGVPTLSSLWSPRLVTPDGACQVYLAPFTNIGGPGDGAKVAVLGDSLVQQLNDPTANQAAYQGYVELALNASGIRAEVEGQGGRRWTPPPGTDALEVADWYLLDEFRGLLEHDVDGFVAALGANDAIAVASGQESWNDVRDALLAVGSEMIERSACLTVVTTPEHDNIYQGADYAWAANQINNIWRYVAYTEPTLNVVDFAVLAEQHRYGDPEPWFVADDLHLNAAGRAVYTEMIAEGARQCADEVVIYGADGSLDGGFLDGHTEMPSGHRAVTRPVDGLTSLPGQSWWFSTVAPDDALLIGGTGSAANPFLHNGEGMEISALHPDSGDFYIIQFETDTGYTTRTGLGGEPMGWEVGDVEVVDDDVVVFTGASTYGDLYGLDEPDPDQGVFPSFGVLTPGPDGRWEVAAQWSSPQLHAAASDPDLADKACPAYWPEAAPQVRDCLSFQQVAVMPHSGHLVVTQYVPPPGRSSGNITVLDLSQDSSGAFELDILAVFEFPDIPNPNAADGELLVIAPLEVSADPTSSPGDERFAVKFDTFFGGTTAPMGIVEFSYDATAGTIDPVSPPVYLGVETNSAGNDIPLAGGHTLYDDDGNLWLPSVSAFVYANHASGRRISDGSCQPGAEPLDPSYTVDLAGYGQAWGVICAPDYEIVQSRQLSTYLLALVHDPTTDNIISVDRFGSTVAIDVSGSGDEMTFRVSNAATISPHAVGESLAGTRPCPTEDKPDQRCAVHDVRSTTALPIGVDSSGRAWTAVAQRTPRPPDGFEPAPDLDPMAQLDQWVTSVDQSVLWGRQAHGLTARPGGHTLVQAERGEVTTTRQQSGTLATTDVVADATVVRCFDYAPWLGSCRNPWDPESPLRGGLALGSHPFAGVPAGPVSEYRVVVPKDGAYQITYRVTDLGDADTDTRIQLTANGATHLTPVPSGGVMRDVVGPTVSFPAGTHIVELVAPEGHEGWQLDWIRFERI